MTTASDSLRVWLRQQIPQTLTKRGAESPFLIWCDPQRVWRELLLSTAEDSAFDEISYFKVFTLEAADVRQWTLPEALASYGVEIFSEQLVELNSLLAAHVKEWFDHPKDHETKPRPQRKSRQQGCHCEEL
jgi:hypothetical protein